MSLNWRVIVAVILSFLFALLLGLTEETYTHIFSSYFSNEFAESYGYLYYYQFNLLFLAFKPILIHFSEKLNWYNVVISATTVLSIFTIIFQFAKFKSESFIWITVFVAAVLFSINISNIHFTRAAVLCALVCVSSILFNNNIRVLILFFLIGLLTRNEMFWLTIIATSPFLLLHKEPFSLRQKIALSCLGIIPLLMFSIANFTRFYCFKTQYLYEKNLDTGGFFFSWKPESEIRDSVQFVKYKVFDNDILADTINVPQEYLIANFRYSDWHSIFNGQIVKLKGYVFSFTDYVNYPILSFYLLSFVLLTILYLLYRKRGVKLLQRLLGANMLSFIIICGVSCIFKYEPAYQETLYTYIIFINFFYLFYQYKKCSLVVSTSVFLLFSVLAFQLYSKQAEERNHNHNIAKLKNVISEKCKGQLVYPVGRVFNVFFKHSNPYVLNDISYFKDVLFISNYGIPILYLGFNEKINQYFSANVLYNLEVMQQITNCNSCNGVFIATPYDIDIYKTYYRLIYNCNIEFKEIDKLGTGLPFVEQVSLYSMPVLK